MTFNGIEYSVKQHIKLDPNAMTLIEAGLYIKLLDLYSRYDDGKITVEDAKAEKEKLIADFNSDFTAISEFSKLVRQIGDMMQTLEQHRAIFKADDARRVELSSLMCEANKHGCEICKKIARVYDGRF